MTIRDLLSPRKRLCQPPWKLVRFSFTPVYDNAFHYVPFEVLLQLHRQFFTRALTMSEEPFSRRHRYAPSVVAVFLSASRLIASLQEFHNHEPLLAGRILGYWSNAHSAAVSNNSLLLYSCYAQELLCTRTQPFVRPSKRYHFQSPLEVSSDTNHSRHLTTGCIVSPCVPRPICMSLSGGPARIGTCQDSVPCCKGYMSKSNANCCEYAAKCWIANTELE
jgi:hypothetical protein